MGKIFPRIAAVSQHINHLRQRLLVLAKHRQGTRTIAHIGRRDPNRMRQSLGVDGNVPFDPRYFLAGVIALVLCLSVFLTLCASMMQNVVLSCRAQRNRSLLTTFF